MLKKRKKKRKRKRKKKVTRIIKYIYMKFAFFLKKRVFFFCKVIVGYKSEK